MSAPPDGGQAAPPPRADLSAFRPAAVNANRHTVRGLALLDDAMSRDGYVAPITVAADGEALDGSARLERVVERFPGVEPIVVQHDGTRPIIAVRTDIPNARTPQAQRIAVAANRIAEVDLAWDVEVLSGLAEDLDLVALGFDDSELKALAGIAEPPESFPEVDENLETEHCCPKCGYRWSGKAGMANGAVDANEA